MCGPQLHGGRPLISRPRAGHARPLQCFPIVPYIPHKSKAPRRISGDVGVAAGDLAVQVRQADLVIVDQVQRADVCQPCKV